MIEPQSQQQTQSQTQSQSHGFIIENDIREKCFGLEYENNNTDRHDIPKEKNKHDENENCSIKTTGSNMIDCGDLLSFHGYDFDEKNNQIVRTFSLLFVFSLVFSFITVSENLFRFRRTF